VGQIFIVFQSTGCLHLTYDLPGYNQDKSNTQKIEILSMPNPEISFDQLDGFVFDLDGTIYKGEEALPGAVQLLEALRVERKNVLFVSNKPLSSREDYAHKLTGLGIPTNPDQIITSAYVLGHHLSRTEPDLNYYVLGEENLRIELRGHGLNLIGEFDDQDEKAVIDTSSVDAVVVAFDRTLNYRKLNTAYQALLRGARFYATNADKACPMPGGSIPDAGATIAALEHITSRKVELVAGKPSQMMSHVVLQLIGSPPERCIMFGDRLETDIRMGKEAGMCAALVLTGATKQEDIQESVPAPDLVLANVGEFLKHLRFSKS
jgi:NagD protein